LEEQFLPNNTSWIAREDLKKLRQHGSVREYVKKFSSLIRDIDNMFEDDRLFNFLSGLQPWAQMELRRQKVSDLSSTIAGADVLVDLRPNDSDKNAENTKNSKVKANGKGLKSNLQCFICKGNHFANECPLKAQLSAIFKEKDGEGMTYVNLIRVLSTK
jgi:hypothetical protein